MFVFKLALFFLIGLLVSCSTLKSEKKIFFKNVTGAKLKVIERGTANQTPIILIHGGPGFPGGMWNLAEIIPRSFTVEYFQRDIRNSPSLGPFTVKEHVNDLHELINSYTKKPILIGHSWGATLALEYAKKYSAEVRKIILISPGTMNAKMSKDFANKIFKSAKGKEKEARQMWDDLKKIKNYTKYQEMWNKYFDLIKFAYCFNCKNFMHKKMTFKPVPVFNDAENSSSIKKISEDYWSLVESGQIARNYKKIKDQIIHLQPEFDVNPSKDLIQLLQTGIENYKLYFLRNTGHFPWLEPQSRKFVKNILNIELKH